MEVLEHYDYALLIKFKWDKTRRNKTLNILISSKMPAYKPAYAILTKAETDKKVEELRNDICRIFADKLHDVYYVEDNVEKEEFTIKMNSKWTKEEELKHLNKRLAVIAREILCY